VPPSRRLLADPPEDRGSPRVGPQEQPAPQRTQVTDHRDHNAAAPEKRPSSDVCSGLGCLVDPHSCLPIPVCFGSAVGLTLGQGVDYVGQDLIAKDAPEGLRTEAHHFLGGEETACYGNGR